MQLIERDYSEKMDPMESINNFVEKMHREIDSVPENRYSLLRNQEQMDLIRSASANLGYVLRSISVLPEEQKKSIYPIISQYVMVLEKIWKSFSGIEKAFEIGYEKENEARKNFVAAEEIWLQAVSGIGFRRIFASKAEKERLEKMPRVVKDCLESIKDAINLQEKARMQKLKLEKEFNDSIKAMQIFVDQQAILYQKAALFDGMIDVEK